VQRFGSGSAEPSCHPRSPVLPVSPTGVAQSLLGSVAVAASLSVAAPVRAQLVRPSSSEHAVTVRALPETVAPLHLTTLSLRFPPNLRPPHRGTVAV
jgi:hypothetical protein